MACDQDNLELISIAEIGKLCKIFAVKLQKAGLKSITKFTFENSRYFTCYSAGCNAPENEKCFNQN